LVVFLNFVLGVIERAIIGKLFQHGMDERLANCLARAFFSRNDWCTKAQFIQGLHDCCLDKDNEKKMKILLTVS
jgi:hypothetical protein